MLAFVGFLGLWRFDVVLKGEVVLFGLDQEIPKSTFSEAISVFHLYTISFLEQETRPHDPRTLTSIFFSAPNRS